MMAMVDKELSDFLLLFFLNISHFSKCSGAAHLFIKPQTGRLNEYIFHLVFTEERGKLKHRLQTFLVFKTKQSKKLFTGLEVFNSLGLKFEVLNWQWVPQSTPQHRVRPKWGNQHRDFLALSDYTKFIFQRQQQQKTGRGMGRDQI